MIANVGRDPTIWRCREVTCRNQDPSNRVHLLASDKISGTPTQVLQEMANNIKNTNDIKYKSNNTKQREKQ
jgi:hypothetical protein